MDLRFFKVKIIESLENVLKIQSLKKLKKIFLNFKNLPEDFSILRLFFLNSQTK